MNNKKLIIILNEYQNDKTVSSLLCKCGLSLSGKIKKDKVVLICKKCKYEQELSSSLRQLLITMSDIKGKLG